MPLRSIEDLQKYITLKLINGVFVLSMMYPREG
ncbi:MAG: hypothetical protein K0R51_2345 [Cytophagaceae bacterium]|jgi:hypothetical protein|nr:hypothetical protein [Cytophagaceae bacterium]